MRKVIVAFLGILLASLARTQSTVAPHTTITSGTTGISSGSGGGGKTFTLLQKAFGDNSTQISTCGNNTVATCLVPLGSATGAGNLLVISSTTSASIAMSSISGGGTFVHCSNCAAGITATGFVDQGYVLSGTGGVSSITVTFSGTDNGRSVEIREYSVSGGSAVFDVSSSNQTSLSSPYSAIALSLTGTNDVIIEVSSSDAGTTAVASPYNTNAEFSTFGNGWADRLNTSSGAAPSWTAAGTTAQASSGMAFK